MNYRTIPVQFTVDRDDHRTTQSWPVTVCTPPHRWNYGSVSTQLDFSGWPEEMILVKVVVRVQEGQVGIGLISTSDHSRFVVPESILEPSGEAREVVFAVPTDEGCRICVRTGDADYSGRVEVLGVCLANDAKQIKSYQVAAFTHWYYIVDLGDGLVVRATVADEPGWTRANAFARAIFSYLIQSFIGAITGARLLDVACSAGHFSFLFAGMGAKVQGFDHDQKAIEQARLVAKYIGQEWAGSLEFSVSDLEDFAVDRPFDIVVCSGLFYHLRDPLRGAQKLRDLCGSWLILQSCVSDRTEPVFELSDHKRWPFCADWELCLVPSASMVRAVFEKVGFEVRGMFRLSDFTFDSEAGTARCTPGSPCPEIPGRLGDPVYLILEKTKLNDASSAPRD